MRSKSFARFGNVWPGLVTWTQIVSMAPAGSQKFSHIATVCRPGFGLMRPSGRFQNSSHCRRCAALATTLPPGSVCASVPTSRTVPHADG